MQGSSPTVREAFLFAYALPHGRATAPFVSVRLEAGIARRFKLETAGKAPLNDRKKK
jgi:hypothetical protein